jgi:hypothetical protein
MLRMLRMWLLQMRAVALIQMKIRDVTMIVMIVVVLLLYSC